MAYKVGDKVRLKKAYRGYLVGEIIQDDTGYDDGYFTLRIPNVTGYRVEGFVEEDFKGLWKKPHSR